MKSENIVFISLGVASMLVGAGMMFVDQVNGACVVGASLVPIVVGASWRER